MAVIILIVLLLIQLQKERHPSAWYVRLLFQPVLICVLGLVDLCAQTYSDNADLKYLFSEKNEFQFNNIKGNNCYLLMTQNALDSTKTIFGKGFEAVRKFDKSNYVVKIVGLDKDYYNKITSTNIRILNDLWKLSPPLLQKYVNDSINFPLWVQFKTFDKIDGIVALENSVKLIELERIDRNGLCFKGKLPDLEAFLELIHLEDIAFIESASTTPAVENNVLDYNMTWNAIDYMQAKGSISGQGMYASVKELMYDTADLDLLGKHQYTEIQASGSNRHATEMATLIAGSGNSFVKGNGVAPEALLYSSDYNNLSADDSAYFVANNIYVQNHSYGTSLEPYYGIYAQSYDDLVARVPTLLHVFSIGNSGTETNTSGTYAEVERVSNITGNFKMSKNTISVGATDSTYSVPELISVGPAYDGRIKPELVAYSSSGSSGAAALVSGVGVILQKDYKEKYQSYPPAALLKAVLINGAIDVGREGPDYESGFGSLDAQRSFQIMDDQTWKLDSVQANKVFEFNIEVPEGIKTLKATLVWTDLPATVNATPALINDLDMIVKTPEDKETFPWVMNTYPALDSLDQLAKRGVDHLNNVEQITIQQPDAGTYKVEIKGTSVSGNVQSFAVAYQLEKEGEFTWLSPIAKENLSQNGEKSSLLRWRSTLSSKEGSLAYRLLGEDDWQLMSSQVDLENGFYTYVFSEQYEVAQLRMQCSDGIFLSDTFLISQPLLPEVGFNCEDSLMLKWDGAPNITHFEVQHLDGAKMQPLTMLNDTSIVIYKNQLTSNYLSVTPYYDNIPFQSSYTFDYAVQGVGCYVINFLASVQSDYVALQLNLGTTYQVSKVTFLRVQAGDTVEVGTIEHPAVNTMEMMDYNPLSGTSTYLANVYLDNEEMITTTSDLVYYLAEDAYLVFPNPVAASEDIHIYSHQNLPDNIVFSLFNIQGKEIFQTLVNSDRDQIRLVVIPPGPYIYTVGTDQHKQRGKLIVK